MKNRFLCEIGQPVKISVANKWVCGTYLDEVPGNKAMVDIRGKKQVCDVYSPDGKLMIRKHMKLDRLPDGSVPELDNFASKHWESLKTIVSLGMTKIIGNKAPNLEFDEEEKSISIENGWITIAPGIQETFTILGFLEKPSWFVSMAVPIDGGRWEPPDVDVVEVGDSAHVVGAAELFVATFWKAINRDFWDSIEVNC